MKQKNRSLLRTALIIAAVIMTGSLTCQKYLEARPDKKQVVPATLQDLQALLDNVAVMNRNYPNYGEGAADNYYLTASDFGALSLNEDRNLYTWKPDGIIITSQWLSPYKVVYYANQVLESLGENGLAAAAGGPAIKGAAFFFRGYAFLQVAGIFSPAYNPATADRDLGVPLRLTADFNPRSVRASNAQTYNQVVSDLRQAAALLPLTSTVPSRPNRVAAYAALSRVLLLMGDYKSAGLYADSCLAAGAKLLDFNGLKPTAANPISRFNAEVLFYAMAIGANTMYPATCKVDSALYLSYAANDLRKTIFFKSNGNGTYAFKGNYDGVQSATLFSGPATDEVYLNAAECQARLGETGKAMDLLNTLLKTRYRVGTFVPLSAGSADAALVLVLTERRKELLFRGLRWADLKRLNLDERFRTTLQRNVAGTVYTLPPGDLRYQLLIPEEVISQSGIAQNPR
ncbi:RagB/SusD family nutrient uptake outer membrane protein [Mucilaginibacter sp. BJC16-A38]|uniref:RagB/SusD family nutrient uptake outer membrane protein n=1 Tax=Mucilaginibacter phenanthrenivorans TaxID=1234842 RepID=UPI002157F36D|nr:RagB/SusD family nutrient uptake outer membrane protein [Mucilaginibacter phenanthrenivorans]MCR8560426.1 RagB/SusD family nutrient uptake outer membrane protein [Mucilaginibacter phenanthrenivorans]